MSADVLVKTPLKDTTIVNDTFLMELGSTRPLLPFASSCVWQLEVLVTNLLPDRKVADSIWMPAQDVTASVNAQQKPSPK